MPTARPRAYIYALEVGFSQVGKNCQVFCQTVGGVFLTFLPKIKNGTSICQTDGDALIRYLLGSKQSYYFNTYRVYLTPIHISECFNASRCSTVHRYNLVHTSYHTNHHESFIPPGGLLHCLRHNQHGSLFFSALHIGQLPKKKQ